MMSRRIIARLLIIVSYIRTSNDDDHYSAAADDDDVQLLNEAFSSEFWFVLSMKVAWHYIQKQLLPRALNSFFCVCLDGESFMDNA